MASIPDLEKQISDLKNGLLNNNQEKQVYLMSKLPFSIFCCLPDKNHTDVFLSDGCYDLTGYKPSELVNNPNLNYKNLILEDYGGLIGDDIEINKALADRSSYHLVYRIKTKSGETKWVYEQGTGIFSEYKEPIAIIGLVTDFTAQIQSELALKKENLILRATMQERYRFGNIIGKSPAMQNIYELILKAASIDANVIITGETGTGKELVAKAIHDASSRSANNFVPVNCGAIPEGLIESEFFGHKKGAFTGAYSDRTGYLHQADKGTLFMDEVGDIDLKMQIKLLRAIEDGTYMPVGEHLVKKSDFRIISATNKDIKSLVNSGNIRQDFYYRIGVIPITLPPLRDRKEDIPLIIEELLEREGMDQSIWQILGHRMEALLEYSWPGNVRELQNVIKRLTFEDSLDFMKHSPINFSNTDSTSVEVDMDPEKMGYKNVLDEIEKKLLLRTLKKTDWNKSRTASLLNISRKALSGRIVRLKLKKS